MSKKQTAMQELVDRLEYLLIDYPNAGLKTAKDIANELLSKEREQIEEAYIDGMEFIPVDPDKYKSDAEQYYTQTYGECTPQS